MKKHLLRLAPILLCSLNSFAAVPPPEKLLPDDTLIMMTTPDFAKARDVYNQSPQTQLWHDPAMKAFKDKFLEKLKSEFITPLERDLNVKFEDYTGLQQGQLTFALTQDGWQGKGEQTPGWLFLLDAKDKSGQLKTNL